MKTISLPWRDPLALAHHFRDAQHLFLLYSGRKEVHTGRYSYLGIGARDTRIASSFADLPADQTPYWFGYLGYNMRHDVENYTPSKPSIIDVPKSMFTAPEHVFVFDHETQTLECHTETSAPTLPAKPVVATITIVPGVSDLQSNFTDTEYLECVAATVKKIEAGDFYQANITRKYWGALTNSVSSFDIYLRLCDASPAPYSAFLRWGDISIISSSPECFLSIDGDSNITARPIKGSAGRSEDAVEDAKIIAGLKASAKDQAENLMIVDLLRNDLARVSQAGSVEVTEQSGLYSYSTIHHLISTIRAKLKPTVKRAEVLKACFPPGSMTGAPKIAAVEWCNAQERLERGVYSGAIGWLGAGNQCDLSVVIRTIVMKGNQLEFQVGGGIVADSVPEKELQETLIKARGISAALGIAPTQLQR